MRGCRFFPIFFAKEVDLSPVAVNILMGAQPLAIGVFATFGQRLSVYVGMAPTPTAPRIAWPQTLCAFALTYSGGWAVGCCVSDHGLPSDCAVLRRPGAGAAGAEVCGLCHHGHHGHLHVAVADAVADCVDLPAAHGRQQLRVPSAEVGADGPCAQGGPLSAADYMVLLDFKHPCCALHGHVPLQDAVVVVAISATTRVQRVCATRGGLRLRDAGTGLTGRPGIGVQKSRGKWSAVDSIVAFGWSGSAFIGGILVDRAGFDWCFLITAMAQATGWLVRL